MKNVVKNFLVVLVVTMFLFSIGAPIGHSAVPISNSTVLNGWASNTASSIAVDSSGHQHVAYFDWANKHLCYASWNGYSWDSQIVDSLSKVTDISLALDPTTDRPTIAFVDASNLDPMILITSFDNTYSKGTLWPVTSLDYYLTSFDQLSYDGLFLRSARIMDMKVDRWGDPHLVYQNRTDGSLISLYIYDYGKATEQGFYDVIDDNTKVFTDETGFSVHYQTGDSPAIAVDSNGYEHVAYFDDSGNLWYNHFNGNFWSKEIVFTITHESWLRSERFNDGPSIALDKDGYPYISFFNTRGSRDNSNVYGSLMITHWTGILWKTETVDYSGDAGWGNSLTINSFGYPSITYFDIGDFGHPTFNMWPDQTWVNPLLKYAYWNGASWSKQSLQSVEPDMWNLAIFTDKLVPTLRCATTLDSHDNAHIIYTSSLNRMDWIASNQLKYLELENHYFIFGETGIDSSYKGKVVNVDGIDYGVTDLPKAFMWDVGSVHSYEFYNTGIDAGYQYKWTGNNGNALFSNRIKSSGFQVPASGGNVIQATYKIQYTVYFSVNFAGSGTITADTPSDSPYWYDSGRTFTITATPTPGWSFDAWSFVPRTGYPSNAITFADSKSATTSALVNGYGVVWANFKSNAPTTPPDVTSVITSGTKGNNLWYTSSSVTLNVRQIGTSEVQGITYWTDGGARITTPGTNCDVNINGDGVHYIYAYGFNTVGNGTTHVFEVDIDSTAPTISLVNPADGQVVLGNSYVRIIPSDDFSGVDGSSAKYSIDSTALQNIKLNYILRLDCYSANFDTSLISDGVHNLRISVSDSAGNTKESLTTITVANHPPQISVGLPNNIMKNPGPRLFGTVSGGGAAIANVMLKIDDGSFQPTVFTQTSWYFDVLSPLSDGPHVLTLLVINGLGISRQMVADIIIDTAAPISYANVLSGVQGNNGWYVSPVKVQLHATETVLSSGVKNLVYSVDGGAQTVLLGTDASVTIAGDKIHTLTFYAIDFAGNVESQKTITVKIDAAAPLISLTATRDPDNNGWYNKPVSFKLSASDGISGIASAITPDSYSGPDGNAVTVTGSATDAAGNVATTSLTIKYDSTAPTGAVFTADKSPNAAGWYTSPVTWTVSGATDATSGGVTYDSPIKYSGPDSASASVTGHATDAAGNVAPVTVNFKYDSTAPMGASLTPDRSPDNNGWYNHAVTWTVSGASDATSKVTYDGPFTYSGPDSALATVTGHASDAAGNIASVSTSFKYDSTAPSLTVVNPSENLALQGKVTFDAQTLDGLSGVASVTFSILKSDGTSLSLDNLAASSSGGDYQRTFDTTMLPDGYYTLITKTTDNAGNTATTTLHVSIRNLAVTQLLPSTISSNAGRTMPIKFSLRVSSAVDTSQPFVANQELTINVYQKNAPTKILQSSTFGSTSTDYRIDLTNQLYITNFQTLKTLATYNVDIFRGGLLLGSFEFSTIK